MSDDISISTILHHDDAQGVRWITFNRPNASNAFALPDLEHVAQLVAPSTDPPKAVVFTGALATPAAIRERLGQADLFVLPSRFEGYPNRDSTAYVSVYDLAGVALRQGSIAEARQAAVGLDQGGETLPRIVDLRGDHQVAVPCAEHAVERGGRHVVAGLLRQHRATPAETIIF